MPETPLLPSARRIFMEGVRDGIPIALGYLVVAFTLGIAAKNAGLSPLQGFFASLFNNASAGEYAGFTTIAADAPYFEIAIITLIANARYFLMSCVLSQKFAPNTSIFHRMCVGFDVTDEIFGITVARRGYIEPIYNYGAMAVALPGWSLGTLAGVIAGNVLPVSAVSALSVTLYGMFLWIIIPAAKADNMVAFLVAVGFLLSFLATEAPILSELSAGTRTILLTVLLAGFGAYLKPLPKVQIEAEGQVKMP